MEEDGQENNEFNNTVRSREVGPEELKEDSEKSNLATANSIESRNMKDFMQENNLSGLSGENEKKPGEETDLIEAEEIYKSNVTNYLIRLYDIVSDQVYSDLEKKQGKGNEQENLSQTNKPEKKGSVLKSNDGNQGQAENNVEQENNEEELKVEKNEDTMSASKRGESQKKVHFRSTETEIKRDFQFIEETSNSAEKFGKIKLIPDFLMTTPNVVTETSMNSISSFTTKIKEKSLLVPETKSELQEKSNNLDSNIVKFYEVTAKSYLFNLYKGCNYRSSVSPKNEPTSSKMENYMKSDSSPPDLSNKKEQSSKTAKTSTKHPVSANPNPKQISKSLPKSKPPESKTVNKPDKIKELQSIKSEKEKIHDKIKEIEGKIISVSPILEPLRTPTKGKPKIRPTPQKSQNDADVFLKKMQENKQEFELKKAQKMEEKECLLKADIEKLNSEKQKIIEVFKLEKEKLFWRKMHELEERKADRIQKELEYKNLVKEKIKNNQYPVKTPELDKRKQEIALKKKLLTDYANKVRLEQIEKLEKSPPKKPQEKIKKPVRSLTPNQRPNYLLEIKQKNKEYQEKAGVRLKRDYENWEKYLKDEKLNKNEKFTSVLNRAQIMENQAKMKEKVAAYNKGGIDIDVENEINELYVDSIKAKIALLEKLKD